MTRRWAGATGDARPIGFEGRACVPFGDRVDLLGLLAGLSMTVGAVEADAAVTGERAFHGMVWRVLDEANYESFYVPICGIYGPPSSYARNRGLIRCATSRIERGSLTVGGAGRPRAAESVDTTIPSRICKKSVASARRRVGASSRRYQGVARQRRPRNAAWNRTREPVVHSARRRGTPAVNSEAEANRCRSRTFA